MNASKLKKASGPFYRERIVKEGASRHMDVAIERVLKEGLTPEITINEGINDKERVEYVDIRKEVD